MSEGKSLLFRQRDALRKYSRDFFEKNATPLEKSLLQQHSLLLSLSDFPLSLLCEKVNKLPIIVGTAQGVENAFEALKLSNEIINEGGANETLFIISGAIGVSKGEYKQSGVRGADAEVLAKFMERSGIDVQRIYVDAKSENAPEQATEVGKIIKDLNLNTAATVLDIWHGPRFYWTFMNKIPDLNLYTKYVNRDATRISSALFDMGQIDFQQPMFISEIARFHSYADNGTGPMHPKYMMEYISKIIPSDRKDLLKQKSEQHERLMKMWNETHDEVIKPENMAYLSDSTRPSGDYIKK